ncbi:uncharacterized protein SPPG_05342 [Spizellomyces punctatus DAOM BR117]|uniref:Uncharacterized protein n=1 Tax=Spizellomyces punctatus (strain DAOM BR117) TaxID=645134 RepID=A0A0L0HFW6_SPIPD|nr:uncharacterized protein SPPG_05342 [Spizellomyces punctatus DAOM BR117]KNC99967.1 hypothetical protein SPPG_05342 [Spizellomyces punctatus DAOM BR117]|eukprot:XP_016608007.1 hypothetical protein SPPG_05342 [Spizellomyces punctatus DAOM BR117]
MCDYSSTMYRMLSLRFARPELMRGIRGDGQWASVLPRNYSAAGYGNKDLHPKDQKEEVGETHTQRFKNAHQQEATSSNVKSKGNRQSSAKDDIPPPISDPHSTAPTETERLGGPNQKGTGSKKGTYTRT